VARFAVWRKWIISPPGALIGTPTAKEQAMPELAISPEKISFLIEKAQELLSAQARPDN
jgi:hypothetical protein